MFYLKPTTTSDAKTPMQHYQSFPGSCKVLLPDLKLAVEKPDLCEGKHFVGDETEAHLIHLAGTLHVLGVELLEDSIVDP